LQLAAVTEGGARDETGPLVFLHDWQSARGGVKPIYLAQHAHKVMSLKLPEDDFADRDSSLPCWRLEKIGGEFLRPPAENSTPLPWA
jgi:hypothetical protein